MFTNYMIKNYNQAAELMCDYISRELGFNEVTKEVLKARIYTDRSTQYEEMVINKIGRNDEAFLFELELANMLLYKLGLVVDEKFMNEGKLVLPTYDSLQKMKKLMESNKQEILADGISKNV